MVCHNALDDLFVKAVNELGDGVTPKEIIEVMNKNGDRDVLMGGQVLSRKHLESHLQRHKKKEKNKQENTTPSLLALCFTIWFLLVLPHQHSHFPPLSSLFLGNLHDLKMSAPVDHTEQHVEAIPQSTATPNWTNNISDIKTVKVSNLSLATSEINLREFFSSSGDIQHVEMKRENESTQVAYVTFKESHGADTASLLTGAKIADQHVSITLVEHYQLPQGDLPSNPDKRQPAAVLKKAEDVASLVLTKSLTIGKDALNKAKSFDERHQLISNASATVASIDQKIGITDKLSIGTAIVNEKVREMDGKFQVSEKAKSALAVAGPKASNAVSAVMSNPYVSTGASYLSRTFSAVAKVAGDVGTMTKEKPMAVARIELNSSNSLHSHRI
ncbi:hypothetical protein K1719_028209 [Acacia pycnantha]|nr:hypothetical protein K1719_028209 [Acacia pycnantha]